MSEENKEPIGMLGDPSGDISSGRVMKMQAFWTALGLAGTGVVALIVLTLIGKADMAGSLKEYILTAVGMFLGVAVSAEVTQKVTGK